MLLKVENRENEFNIKMRLKMFFCSTGDTIFKVNFMNYIECFFFLAKILTISLKYHLTVHLPRKHHL